MGMALLILIGIVVGQFFKTSLLRFSKNGGGDVYIPLCPWLYVAYCCCGGGENGVIILVSETFLTGGIH